jgi:hypothetical protein
MSYTTAPDVQLFTKLQLLQHAGVAATVTCMLLLLLLLYVCRRWCVACWAFLQ